MLYVSDTASLCSIAPSLHELDAELAQYGDLLDVTEDASYENTTLPDFCEGIVADINSFDVESVKRLSELLPPESEDLDQLALRPTAASLGLKDVIEKCLGDDPSELGLGYHDYYYYCYYYYYYDHHHRHHYASAQRGGWRYIGFVLSRRVSIRALCVHSETLLSRYLAEYLTHFRQTYINDALWSRDERFTVWGQKVKGHGHGGMKYSGNSTFWAC